jgi:hypothetical protein
MKTFKHISIILLLLLSTFASAQQRRVHWIHGMGGTNMDLKQLNEYFNNYLVVDQVYSLRPGYNTDKGIQFAGESLWLQGMSNGALGDIAITHSMGGVNSRWMRKLHTGGFGGLITLDGPHGGAIVADKLKNGQFQTFLNDAVDKGLSGISTSILAVTINSVINVVNFIKAIAKKDPWMNLEGAISYIKDNLYEMVKKIVRSDETQNSLCTTSPEITSLKSYNLNIPFIAVWGNENFPATVRMFGTQFTNGEDVPIGGTNEEIAVNAFNGLHDFCHSQSNICHTASIAAYVVLNIPMGIYWSKQSDRYDVSSDFWGGQFQTGLDWMIGATRYTTATRTVQVLVCGNVMVKQVPIDNGDPDWIADHCYYTTEVQTYSVVTSLPSDGLLPKDLQIAVPGLQAGCIKEIQGVNHQEMKKSTKVVDFLKVVFAGGVIDSRNPSMFLVPHK